MQIAHVLGERAQIWIRAVLAIAAALSSHKTSHIVRCAETCANIPSKQSQIRIMYFQEARAHETSVFCGNDRFLDHWAKIVGPTMCFFPVTQIYVTMEGPGTSTRRTRKQQTDNHRVCVFFEARYSLVFKGKPTKGTKKGEPTKGTKQGKQTKGNLSFVFTGETKKNTVAPCWGSQPMGWHRLFGAISTYRPGTRGSEG